MVTAKKHHQLVTRNVSCFKRTSSDTNSARDSEQVTEGPTAVDSPRASDESHQDESVTTRMPNSPVNPGEVEEPRVTAESGEGSQGRSQRYCLRPNPMPSQRFKDYVQD